MSRFSAPVPSLLAHWPTIRRGAFLRVTGAMCPHGRHAPLRQPRQRQAILGVSRSAIRETAHELARLVRLLLARGVAKPYETITVEKLTPIIGAEITGVDIGKLVSDDRSN